MPRVPSMSSHFEVKIIHTSCMMAHFVLATEKEWQRLFRLLGLRCFSSQCFLMTLESFGTFRSRWQAMGFKVLTISLALWCLC